MNPELDFPGILDAAQAGGEWAFDVLFRHYQPMLLRYLRAQDPRAAEDLAAEVWMALAPASAASVVPRAPSGAGCSPWPAAV